MLTMKVIVFYIFVVLATCDNSISRQNSISLKKETQARVGTRFVRNEVFENLFNVYDPLFLAVVWPKITNGLHILIDYTCWDELGVFFRDLTDAKVWAYSALDASGRYESALYSGNRFWLGSKAQCLHLDKEAMENNASLVDIEKNYNDARDWKWVFHEVTTPKPVPSELWPPYRLTYSTVQVLLNITKHNMVRSHDILLGVCLPESCSARDISSVINFSVMINDNLKTNKTTARTAKVTGVRQVPGHYDIGEDGGAILLICISVLLVTLAVTATVLDLNLMKCLPYGKKTMKFDLEKYHTDTKGYVERHQHNIKNEPNPRKTIDKFSLKNELDKYVMEQENMNYMTVESMTKGAPAITPDVTSADLTMSCRRCGKYRKQCSSPHEQDNTPPCPRLQYNSIVSLSTENEHRNVFRRLLLCFSVSYCWKRVFNTNMATKDLSLIHGMRILATLWIIFLHVAVVVQYISDDTSDINERNNIYYIIATGTIAFDTLFFVSGLFSSHHFFYMRSQYSMEELVGWDGACGQLLQFICFVMNRVIRLLPSYTYAVLLSAVVSRWARAVSTLALPDHDHVSCSRYWWRNLLYVSNIFPVEEQCMAVSWYLSTETQLHTLGALLCAVSVLGSWRARAVVSLALVGALTCTVADASAAYLEFVQLFSSGFHLHNVVIERPWARVAPYFFGVFTGWLVHYLQGTLKVSKVTSSLLWVSSLSFILASVAVSIIELPWLAAWLHLSWPIALLWPTLMGTTNLAGMFRRTLGRAPLAALSRLCYGMVLLHAAVTRAVLLSLDTPLCSQTTCIWVYFAGTTTLTLLAAFALSLLVEIPFCSILRRISDCASS